MKLTTRLRLRRVAVWLSRLLVGATFIISGWAKAIDPWGFLIKVGEYLGVWGVDLPREVILTGCIAMSCIEFSTGVLLLTGSLKRVSVWVASAMMAFLLPLTAYIYVADPVADCGCFGDFVILSNGATLAKNVVLAGLLVYLILYNRAVRGIYAAPIQWLVVAASLAFPLYLAFFGYNIQPLVDFRPYPDGSVMFGVDRDGGDDGTYFIYEKDGLRHNFTLDALPDSTWTYVDAVVGEDAAAVDRIAVRDDSGFDVAEDIVDYQAPQLFLIVNEPGLQFLSRAHYVSELSDFAESHDLGLAGVVAATGDALGEWIEWMRPQFPVYSAEDTALKQLVRGDAALVYAENGIIRWKRTLSSTNVDLSDPDALRRVPAVDDGYYHRIALLAYLIALAIIYLLSLSPKILRLFMPRKDKKFVPLQSENKPGRG